MSIDIAVVARSFAEELDGPWPFWINIVVILMVPANELRGLGGWIDEAFKTERELHTRQYKKT